MGKASLIMVLGMSFILAMLQYSITSRTTDATSNFVGYIDDAEMYNVRTTGAEMAITQMDRSGMTHGTLLDMDIKARPQDGAPTYHLYVVIDSLSPDTFRITSRSTRISSYLRSYDTIPQITRVFLRRASFSQYSYFTDLENSIHWTSGEILRAGEMHTNDFLTIDGSPVFNGHVTSWKNWVDGSTKPAKATPQFNGGFSKGVAITVPNDFSEIRSNMSFGYLRTNDTLNITFNTNGTMTIKSSGINITDDIKDLAPNGLIVANGGDIHVKGTVAGNNQVTIASLVNGSKGGNIYIDDDVKLANMAKGGDMLGLCADNNVIISDRQIKDSKGNWISDPTHPNNIDGIDIQATIMARTASFSAQNYSTRTTASGRRSIRLVGGIIQHSRGAVGLVDGVHGFLKDYNYDPRLGYTRPPFYPMLKAFKIFAWWE